LKISDIISECEKKGLAIKRIRFVYSKTTSETSKIVLIEGSISKVSDIKVEQNVQNEQSSENKESDKTVSETSEEIEIIKFTTDGKDGAERI